MPNWIFHILWGFTLELILIWICLYFYSEIVRVFFFFFFKSQRSKYYLRMEMEKEVYETKSTRLVAERRIFVFFLILTRMLLGKYFFIFKSLYEIKSTRLAVEKN